MDINRIIHLSANAGRIILENGGETYRVEETIIRICASYGIKNADCFVTATGIMLSADNSNGISISIVQRIRKRTVNLEMVSAVNDLSRSIQEKHLTPHAFEESLKQIENISPYPPIFLIFFSAFGTAFFSLLFGGDFKDFWVAFVIGGIVKSISVQLDKVKLNDFFINILGGAIVAFLAITTVTYNLGHHMDKIIIGGIMILVPGLAITNAIRDGIAGDYLSALSRALEAFIIAIAIAIGTGIVLKFWINYFGGVAI